MLQEGLNVSLNLEKLKVCKEGNYDLLLLYNLEQWGLHYSAYYR